MPDLIDARISEVLDGETLKLAVLSANPCNVHRYRRTELMRLIDLHEDLRHPSEGDDAAITHKLTKPGGLVRCLIEMRGSDDTLIGEVEPLPGRRPVAHS
jgi:hypothetical protein